jgi:hypothetical protein
LTGVYTLDPNYVVPSLHVWSGVYKSVEWSLHMPPGSAHAGAWETPAKTRQDDAGRTQNPWRWPWRTPTTTRALGGKVLCSHQPWETIGMTAVTHPYDSRVTHYDSCVMVYDSCVIPQTFRDISVIPLPGKCCAMSDWQNCDKMARRQIARIMPTFGGYETPAQNLHIARTMPGGGG